MWPGTTPSQQSEATSGVLPQISPLPSIDETSTKPKRKCSYDAAGRGYLRDTIPILHVSVHSYRALDNSTLNEISNICALP